MSKITVEEEMLLLYSSTLDILENYMDHLATGGPDITYSLVISLGNALKQVERSITALQMKPYLTESNEQFNKTATSATGESSVVEESCGDEQAPDQECKKT